MKKRKKKYKEEKNIIKKLSTKNEGQKTRKQKTKNEN